MKRSSYPTRIRLNEISENGDDFLYTKETGELSKSLEDLIGNRDHTVKVQLKPMGNVYEITCDFETTMGLNCSRCGRETEHPLNGNCMELLVIEDKRPRNAKSAQSSQEPGISGLFCNHIQSDNFDLTEFVHEQIASNEPFVVECGQSDCVDVLDSLQGQLPKEMGSEKASNPFAALKDLKL